ncbi:S8 family serine peptidase [candidate division KSB1 bacterium]|nr:S8 family serine peptidase [candidate division KSB1 bacterium]
MKNRLCIITVSFLCLQVLNALSLHSQQPIKANTYELRQLSKQYGEIFKALRTEADQWAKDGNLPIISLREDGTKIELQRIRQNIPIYYMTLNLNAAKTVSADRVWPGGDAGLNLTGQGITIGQWDGGGVRTTHQEFAGRAMQKDSPGSVDYHATHVAGTLIAQGINPNAKGMAPSANLIAFDWNYDFSEMAAEAANGLLSSNHSYGNITGWYYDYMNDGRWAWFGDPSVSQTEDYRFGFYDEDAQYFDEIAYNAPYYLIVKSAGNDRNDYGPSSAEYHWVYNGYSWSLSSISRDQDGGADGYDCIAAGGGTAKNTLVVGAIYDIPGGYASPSSIQMSSFSSYGPTDDGRIKPDIIANGVNLYSSWNTSNTAYETISGTSMSTPNACGSLALLQENYKSVHGNHMRAATLKGLIAHTADEAGSSDGPDYRHGWGLLNVKKAALLINEDQLSDDTIQELTLLNNQSYAHDFYTDGSPVRITISWTDPPHDELPESLNPNTPVLVNDLDLLVLEISSNTNHEPWVLDRNNPDAPAITGNNVVDNVEQIYIPNPNPGNYTLSITHKGVLDNGSQDYSLIISGTSSLPAGCYPPSIAVKDSNGSFGSVVTFNINIEENPDEIDAFGFKLEYDPNVLRYIGTRKTDLTADFDYLDGSTELSNTIIVGGFHTTAIPSMSKGSIAAIDFEVVCTSCIEGDVSMLSLSHLVDDIRSLNICNGRYTFNACQLGDVNGDYTITPQDALCAFSIYLNGGTIPLDFEECNNPCALTASDVTCNQGGITPQDALCILRAYLNHENPPMTCCNDRTSIEKNLADVRLSIPDVTAEPGQLINVPIMGSNFNSVKAFGFDLGYPNEKMSFHSFRPGKLTESWELIDVAENIPGVLTIGGLHIDQVDSIQMGTLIELTFLIKKTSSQPTELWFFNLRDDIQSAQISNGRIIQSNYQNTGELDIPIEYKLAQNYPNPFNPETDIQYDIPKQTFITMAIYNAMGQKIITLVSEEKRAGSHHVVWNGNDESGKPVPSGIYFYRLNTMDFNQTNKMLLIR